VYFLTGKRNPTRILFDFFDADAPQYNQGILDALNSMEVKVVAISTDPWFSRPMNPALARAIAMRFPESQLIGKFELRWRP
jgi:hypothetical protein